ncbi:ammonium transporter [Parvibaculum sp.]|uniref:ammonium transporter n=1 Tax=Parvibaculum sp. TaxID=2024848 RepID=UPI0027314156|nr:ammonium transporter [Parvibaculum sp.]MDP1625925.1 ammonium transporter [Parvibaculum sp.]MDP2149629.1 ammonium transporter [Parvibaculum sp.]MDP3329628.1 ammonium transporter [Parvibaculum sp.]
MTNTGRYTRLAGMAGLAVLAMTAPAFAQEVEEVAEEAFALSAPDTAYVFNTLLFLMTGFLVMFMAAGFAMLEAGLVRSKNVAMQCTKNIALYSVAGIMYYLVGYNLMYSGVDGGYFGSIALWGVDDSGGVAADGTGYASASDWYFQMVFVATAASIVSGTLAERIKLWPFLLFTVFLTGFIYPIQGAWQWGGGWLSELGFSDFAGSTLVHSTGGWAALMGALILGPRIGKYIKGGGVNPMPGSSMPLATLGTFILWLGWFGFNGGSELALGSPDEANAVATIFINTNMAAAAGVVAAMVLTQLLYKKVDITMALNGALAGLVSITAEPLAPTLGWALGIGAIGGVIVVLTVPLLDKLHIDDVVGAIPVHLFCGIWGTMAVPLTNADTNFAAQATGVISIGIFVAVTSLVLWLALRFTVGIRCTEEEEMMGLDKAEIGVEAYPEFAAR